MRRHLIALAWGALGMLCALSVWHLYLDHQNLHTIVNGLTARAKATADGTR